MNELSKDQRIENLVDQKINKDLALLEQYCTNKFLQLQFNKDYFTELLQVLYQFRDIIQGYSHKSLLGYLLFFYATITKQKRSQQRIGFVIGISASTIRNFGHLLDLKRGYYGNRKDFLSIIKQLKISIPQFKNTIVLQRNLPYLAYCNDCNKPIFERIYNKIITRPLCRECYNNPIYDRWKD